MDGSKGAFHGRVGLITGAGSGIGLAIATQLRQYGAIAVALDVNANAFESAVSDNSFSQGTFQESRVDVRNYSEMCAVSSRVLAEYGRLDFVVANAGITDWGSLATGDPDRWRDVIDTNVLGVANTIRATLPTLVAQGQGHVVITSSISGLLTYVGEPMYIASKWALVALGRTLRKEARPFGVRVTLIEPGIVDTPLVRATAEGAAELAALRPLDDLDVARAVIFALRQPAHVNIDEIVLSPLEQEF